MMRIGEFAKAHKITVRTLHHYEDVGLLVPERTDPMTGYRHYGEDQAQKLRIIAILKELGFSLSEISDLLNRRVGRDELLERLDRKYLQARLEREKALIRSLGIEKFRTMVQELPAGDFVNLLEVSPMEYRELAMDLPRDERYVSTFDEMLIDVRDKGSNITLMVMDIDHFDRINKDYGHKVGDAVLDAVRRGIIEKSPGGKGLIWGSLSVLERQGGDEYINWVNVEPEEGEYTAREIVAHIASLDFSYLNMDRNVTISMGVVHTRGRKETVKELISLADEAMMQAKLTGRNRVETVKGLGE